MKFLRVFAFAVAAICLMTAVGCDDDDDVIEDEVVNGDENEEGNEDENVDEPNVEVETPSDNAIATPAPHFDEDASTENSLTLSWEEVDDATSYVVRWWREGDEDNAVEESVRTRSYTLTGLEEGTTYYAQVMACSIDGAEYDSVYSSVISCTTLESNVYDKDAPIQITLFHASASTLTFDWDVNGSATTAASYNYNLELYNDADCTDLWVSWIVTNGLFTSSNDTHVRFTFTGLNPGTPYWLKINVSGDETIYGGALKASTTTFDHEASSNDVAQAGDVLVAEDFSGLIHGGDLALRCPAISTSATANRATYEISRGVNPTSYAQPVEPSTEFNFYTGSNVSEEYTQATGLGDWCIGTGTNTSTRAGYAKIGGGTAYGYLATPVLSTIPEGHNATVRVDFSAMTYSSGDNDYGSSVLVAVVDNAVVSSHQAEGWTTESDSAVLKNYKLVSLDEAKGINMKFVDFSVLLSGVTNESRIRFSSDTFASYSDNKTRFFLDNVVVTVIEIYE